MINLKDTAYPIFKDLYSDVELDEYFSPKENEISFCKEYSNTNDSFFCLLVMLKTFQHLGYFIKISEIPEEILRFISKKCSLIYTKKIIETYYESGTKRRHLKCIREYLNVISYSDGGEELLDRILPEIVLVKNDIVDLINIALEYLIKERFEIPAYRTIFDLCKHHRTKGNEKIYSSVYEKLDQYSLNFLKNLFPTNFEKNTQWNELRTDFGKPSFKTLREINIRYDKLKEISKYNYLIQNLPTIKIKSFYEEANSYDLSSLNDIKESKRIVLILCFLYTKLAFIIDDMCMIFIKRMKNIHHRSVSDLEIYLDQNAEKTEAVFRNFTEIEEHVKSGNDEQKKFIDISNLIMNNQELCNYARTQVENGIKNHNRFMWKYFKKPRKSFFKILRNFNIYSSSNDFSITSAIEFMLFHSSSNKEWIDPLSNRRKKGKKGPISIDFSWIPNNWWKLVTGKNKRDAFPARINRKYFEVCLCCIIAEELQNGDLYIDGSIEYADFRKELVSEEDAEKTRPEYVNIIGIPLDKSEFGFRLKDSLSATAQHTNDTFPENPDFTIHNNIPKLKRIITLKKDEVKLKYLESLIDEKLQKRFQKTLLNILVSINSSLNITRFFSPLSGHQSKIKDEDMRYILTIFAYGTGLGPTQTAKAVPEVNRRKISFLNIRHSSVDKIDEANRFLINLYNKFDLPKLWGTGKRAAGDGTYWEIYDNNLLSEYHIRYGQFGGIAYYHVSDNYIAIFSHFISCGVREGVFILDGLTKNKSDVQPDTIHGDTHAQMLTAFGLSYLLGIKLMPRIKNWKDYNFYKPSPESNYENIIALFTKEKIDWDLIELHYYDMLRVAQSIKAGKINPSTILKRLNSSSKKNKLYFAFKELGCVIRTIYLLQYLSDDELRRVIQSATNKCESFNKFVKWLYFGADMITKNDRDDQLKSVKYAHLIANILTFYNVYSMTKVVKSLSEEGHKIDSKIMARISPYRTAHINRFGTYEIQDEKMEEIEYSLNL